MIIKKSIIAIFLLTFSLSLFAFDFDHKGYQDSIAPHITYNLNMTASKIDYSKVELKKLDKYIESLLKVSRKEFDGWKKNDQLAFLINTYNALTIKLIIKEKPKKSIKEIGNLFKSTWKKKFFTLFGEESNLDRLEHELTRGSDRYNDPRIHFAFNCASIGCPAIQKEPFIGKKIDEQLDSATMMFLKDRNRNFFKENKLSVSKIFDWYEGDFKKGHRGFSSLKDFFGKYAESLTDNPKELDIIKSKGEYEIEFQDYDWNLNNKF